MAHAIHHETKRQNIGQGDQQPKLAAKPLSHVLLLSCGRPLLLWAFAKQSECSRRAAMGCGGSKEEPLTSLAETPSEKPEEDDGGLNPRQSSVDNGPLSKDDLANRLIGSTRRRHIAARSLPSRATPAEPPPSHALASVVRSRARAQPHLRVRSRPRRTRPGARAPTRAPPPSVHPVHPSPPRIASSHAHGGHTRR